MYSPLILLLVDLLLDNKPLKFHYILDIALVYIVTKGERDREKGGKRRREERKNSRDRNSEIKI